MFPADVAGFFIANYGACEIGTDARTVSAILGHRETSTTMNIYSHSLQTAEQEAANRMDELLKKQA